VKMIWLMSRPRIRVSHINRTKRVKEILTRLQMQEHRQKLQRSSNRVASLGFSLLVRDLRSAALSRLHGLRAL
jgi:hypothetical protein